MVDLK